MNITTKLIDITVNNIFTRAFSAVFHSIRTQRAIKLGVDKIYDDAFSEAYEEIEKMKARLVETREKYHLYN